MSGDRKGSAYVMISGLLYGLLGYFGMKIVNNNISVNNMLFWRFFVASLLIIIMIFKEKPVYKVDIGNMLKALIYGSIFYSAGTVFYFMSSTYIGTGLAMTIFFIYPSIIILFNWIRYRHAINRIYFTSMILTAIGMILLINPKEFTVDLFGIFLAILSALAHAIYIIRSKGQLQSLPPLVSTLMISFGSCIIFMILSLLDNTLVIPSFSSWLFVVLMSVICTALPILFLLKGLQYISSEKAAILTVLEPVLVVIIGVMFLGEEITVLSSLGVIIMLSSAIIIQWDKLVTKTVIVKDK